MSPVDMLSPVPNPSSIIPRGGQCPSCESYILWGDIVRGIYRRRVAQDPAAYSSDEEVQDEGYIATSPRKKRAVKASASPTKASKVKSTKRRVSVVAQQLESLTLNKQPEALNGAPAVKKKKTATKKKVTKSTTTKKGSGMAEASSDEGEFFDLEAISTSSKSDSEPILTVKVKTPRCAKKQPTKRGKAHSPSTDASTSVAPLPTLPPRQLTMDDVIASVTRRTRRRREEEYEFFDLDGITTSSDTDERSPSPPRRKKTSQPSARRVRQNDYIEISD
jgi:structure-specific endonuclease subunit SLX1